MKTVTVVTRIQKRPLVQAPARPDLWMQLEDRESGVFLDANRQPRVRSCAPCPAVFVMLDDPHAQIGEQQQYFLRGINYLMTVENVYLLLDKALAFANGTGFRMSYDPRADWFHRVNLQRDPPNLDKVRTCSRSVMTGTPVYKILTALQQTIEAARQAIQERRLVTFRASFRSLLTAPNMLRVTTFDSRQPPPLKPGRSYPSRVEDVDPDAYLYTPRTHPWLFLTANIVNRSGEVVQFPRGAVYPWTADGAPRSWVPHISNPNYGPVDYPLRRLRKLSASEPIPSPYRMN